MAAGIPPAREIMNVENEEWVNLLRRNNELLAERNRLMSDWKLAARNGLIAGFAGAVGATMIVSILLAALKPFEKVDALRPAIERIADDLNRNRPK